MNSQHKVSQHNKYSTLSFMHKVVKYFNFTLKNIYWGRVGKRSFDIFVASTALALLFPLILILCTAVWVYDGGPPIFKHRRVGRGGKYFFCLKLRSMTVNSEAVLALYLEQNAAAREEWDRNHKLVHDPRITWMGRFLRKSSLDELPQLVNVLRGEMSLVGPRPIVDAEIARYGEAFAHCFSVCPGITGLWQVSGRSDCDYVERVNLDLKYAADWSIKRDFYILAKTIPAVLSHKGSY